MPVRKSLTPHLSSVDENVVVGNVCRSDVDLDPCPGSTWYCPNAFSHGTGKVEPCWGRLYGSGVFVQVSPTPVDGPLQPEPHAIDGSVRLKGDLDVVQIGGHHALRRSVAIAPAIFAQLAVVRGESGVWALVEHSFGHLRQLDSLYFYVMYTSVCAIRSEAKTFRCIN